MTDTLTPYIFIRGRFWYAVDLRDDDEACRNALSNAGVTRVENAVTGETVWQANPDVGNA